MSENPILTAKIVMNYCHVGRNKAYDIINEIKDLNNGISSMYMLKKYLGEDLETT